MPAASKALMVTVFIPTSSGIAGTLQLVVPLAIPESPFEVDQVTDVTPTLSDAVPENAIEFPLTETVVMGGSTIVKVGAVVCGPVVVLGDVGVLGCVGA